MRIITTRRISQIFFLLIFLWFGFVATLGEAWWQLRGWPVNWFLQLDPLICLGTLLTTHTVYKGLLWGLLTIVLTVLLGRFFCGWICPLGSINQFVGFLGKRKKSIDEKAEMNRYHPGQSIKYWILTFLLATAFIDLVVYFFSWPQKNFTIFWTLVIMVLVGIIALTLLKIVSLPRQVILFIMTAAICGAMVSFFFRENRILVSSLQTGLLDPIPLLYRSVNMAILPLIDGMGLKVFSSPRFYDGVWLIGSIFLLIVFFNLKIPRFYCRFICPLGALLGVLSRYSVWRMGKSRNNCPLRCHPCETNCEGACQPSGEIRNSECVLCLNCYEDCASDLLVYQVSPSASGEIVSPDVSRRAFVVSLLSGMAIIPAIRINGNLVSNWDPKLIRPPGALGEKAFLRRCIKCGQCMRICPTNVIHPDVFKSGLEGLWTPVLDFRIGTSGCQVNCIACGNICPTAAIRPISQDERRGVNAFSDKGPIKIGTAFVDRGRCLPWAMDKPCIVCQENCPVSPKAIFTREHFQSIERPGNLRVKRADSLNVEFERGILEPDRYATGDYYCKVLEKSNQSSRRITGNTTRDLSIASKLPWEVPPRPGDRIEIQIRLQQPYVDIGRCIGCGICEHECPVKGKRAIRVTAENESRSRGHTLLLAHNLEK
jgi:polyferredoxin